MIVTKPADFRAKQKEFFQKAYEGEVVVVSRPRNENTVIINQDAYNRLMQERRIMAYYMGLKKIGKLGKDEEFHMTEIIEKIFNAEIIPFTPKTEKEYFERIDKSLKDVEEGRTQDAKEALKEICSEIENAAVFG